MSENAPDNTKSSPDGRDDDSLVLQGNAELSEPAVAMSPAELAEARRYHVRQLVCDLSHRLLDLGYVALFAFLFARPLDNWLATLAWLENRWSRLAAMFVVMTVVHLITFFPLSFYAGFVLEHQFGLSRQSFFAWLRQSAKRHGLALVLGLALVQGLYLVIWLTGGYWWIAAAAAFFIVSVVLGQLAPVLILPMFYKITRLEDDELIERFAALTVNTGLTIEGVYRIKLSADTVKANAMLAGLGSTRRVLLGDTLLDEFSHDEISVVFAHEVGHHVHRHILKLMGAGVLVSAAGFFLCDRCLALWVGSDAGVVSYENLPVYALPFIMFTITVFSFVLEPLSNGVSRFFERQADRHALRVAGQVDAYRSAFNKLARQNKADPDPHRLEVLLFHSHPPIADRLAMADRFSPADK